MSEKKLTKEIFDYIDEFVNIAKRNYPKYNKYPTLKIGHRLRTTAGIAHYKTHHITIAYNIFNCSDNHHALREIVGHEVAHLVAYEVFGNRGIGHGRYWKSVMRTFGLAPKRTHNLKVKTARHKRISIKCHSCGEVHKLTKRKITNVLKAQASGMSHKCRKGKNNIYLINKDFIVI